MSQVSSEKGSRVFMEIESSVCPTSLRKGGENLNG
jgi:hypothetical protein